MKRQKTKPTATAAPAPVVVATGQIAVAVAAPEEAAPRYTQMQMRTAIETALATVPFSPPMSMAYCENLRDALRPALPGCLLEVCVRGNSLDVGAWCGRVTCTVSTSLA